MQSKGGAILIDGSSSSSISLLMCACAGSVYVILSGKLSVHQHPIFGDNIQSSAPVIQPHKAVRKQLGKLHAVLGKWRWSKHIVFLLSPISTSVYRPTHCNNEPRLATLQVEQYVCEYFVPATGSWNMRSHPLARLNAPEVTTVRVDLHHSALRPLWALPLYFHFPWRRKHCARNVFVLRWSVHLPRHFTDMLCRLAPPRFVVY